MIELKLFKAKKGVGFLQQGARSSVVLALLFLLGSLSLSSAHASYTMSPDSTTPVALQGQHFPENPRILSRQEIEAALAPALVSIKKCYDTLGGSAEGAQGRLVLNMLIRPEGTVLTLRAQAPGIPGNEIEKCIQKLSTQWRFPKRMGYTNATVPFDFRKQEIPLSTEGNQ